MSAQRSDMEMSIEFVLQELRLKVEKLSAENRRLTLENGRLTKENGDLLDDLHGANEAVKELQAMANRAHTGEA